MLDCFIDLITIKPVNKSFDNYCDNLLETYTVQDVLFPPNIWRKFGATKNSCERFHVKLNSSFHTAHPNIFVLLENLLGIPNEIYISFWS